jgi:hypothetical protein
VPLIFAARVLHHPRRCDSHGEGEPSPWLIGGDVIPALRTLKCLIESGICLLEIVIKVEQMKEKRNRLQGLLQVHCQPRASAGVMMTSLFPGSPEADCTISHTPAPGARLAGRALGISLENCLCWPLQPCQMFLPSVSMCFSP